MSRWALLLWLLVTAVLISVAVALSRGGGQVACTGYWSAVCAHPAPASASHAASHGAVVSHDHG
jgi:hypothetical protein